MSAANGATEDWRALIDHLIPGGDGLPAASAVGLHDDLLDKVLRVRPDLRPDLDEALELICGLAPAEAVVALRREPTVYSSVSVIVAGGYLMSNEVTAALGYRYEEAKPVNSEDVLRAVDDGLLDGVVERGPIYRLPPDAPTSAFEAFD
ncbi:hypothetical protein GCM10009789_76390 [Kribbella sancticallisti]|uniref:Uncharacterized protein n=1 Tax=Kribbella sancticallisti TaxID=460087 RepID=A0ABP4QIT1_9ACTN